MKISNCNFESLTHSPLCLSLVICIYSHPQTDLFRSIRTHQCGQNILASGCWDRNPVDSNANPRLYPAATRKPAAAKQILNGYESQ